MSLIVLLLGVPLVVAAAVGLITLFLKPLFDAMRLQPPRATQYFLTDILFFLLMYGLLGSTLFAMIDDRAVLPVFMAMLLLLLAMMWLAGCHTLSRLNVRRFWPRAVGLTCVAAGMTSAIGLAATFVIVLATLPYSVVPLLIWLIGFPLALVLCRLGAAYTLRQIEEFEAP